MTKELKFKTNINCGGCVRSVSGFLNDLKGIEWEVDTSHPDKILTVKGEVASEKVVEVVEDAGFDIQAA